VITLVLSPQGHLEHALYGVDDGEAFTAHVEPGTAPELARFLDSMRFMMRVEVTDESDAYAVVTLTGAEPPADALVTTDGLIVPRKELERDWQARPAGLWAYEALRIAAHRPRLGLDTDHRTIPHEVGWIETAVHLSKGCYRGQETVARVHNLGRPPRRLVLLHLDGLAEQLPEAGTPVQAGTRDVGRVGSVVRHHELGVVALALVKQSVAMDAELTVAGARAAIDPDDAPVALDDTVAAARERVQAVRSGTIPR
jgi:folate-binding protein YgfZ